ncbi:MAG: DUF4157 domain-containing protein [Scytonematopsis contorta HA4267-MV1]|jgi:hypothetical protein|nr:DUF4157 domain-containing protein [Scytonematopsis contorta HA4267-MV1]
MKHQHLSKTQAVKTNQSPQTATNTTSDAHPVLQMQADIGNRATSQILSSQKPIQAKPLFSGLSSELSIQPKLTIGAVGDKYEKEADTVASQVVNRINSPAALTVQREEMLPEDEELMMKPTVQRYSDNQESVAATPDLEASIQQSRGGGQPLPDNIRQPMEQEFGADFGGVKVHANSQADKLNSAIQAKAFTTRQDIFFKQGEYNPNTRGGKELLAHELTHVVQQNGGEVQGQVSTGISVDKIQRTITTITNNQSTSQTNNQTSIIPVPDIMLNYNLKTILLEFCNEGKNLDIYFAWQIIQNCIAFQSQETFQNVINKCINKNSSYEINTNQKLLQKIKNSQYNDIDLKPNLIELLKEVEGNLMDVVSRLNVSEDDIGIRWKNAKEIYRTNQNNVPNKRRNAIVFNPKNAQGQESKL